MSHSKYVRRFAALPPLVLAYLDMHMHTCLLGYCILDQVLVFLVRVYVQVP